MKKEQKVSFSYDGSSESIKNHQIDARILASALDNIADLITAADIAINNQETGVQVKAQAGFVQGSFGVDLIVLAEPSLLKAIGLVAATAAGSALSMLRDLGGRKVETIEVDEDSELATILTTDGNEYETSKEVACLISNKDVRQKIDKLVHQPLNNEGIDSFSVFSRSDDAVRPIIEITTETSLHYKKQPQKPQEQKAALTDAVIEFVTANKESGNSGWRMNYLNYENIPVKIVDEMFLNRIRMATAPKIFAFKFKVHLKTITTTATDGSVKRSYQILKVVGPKKV